MKHNLKVTILLLSMFVVTQIIGIYVVGHYSQDDNELPYGMTPPEVEKESDFYTSFLPSIIIAFVIAISLLFLLTKVNAEFILRLWFFAVVAIALGISINAFFPDFAYQTLIALAVAVPFAFFKVYRSNFFIHNLTEFLIYPGIAAVFSPLLNIWTIIILLILISAYDIWAVWHSGIMQKMAKYQINKLKVFGGFFVPYLNKKVKTKLRAMKKSDLKKKKIKVNLAILGGGDVVFPIITAGVVLNYWGIWAALLVTLGATLGLAYLLINSEKKKFYPAMPFITAGILLGIMVSFLLF